MYICVDDNVHMYLVSVHMCVCACVSLLVYMCVDTCLYFSGLSDETAKKQGEVISAQSYPALCNPMDCIVLGILQARILEWVAIPFSE